MFVYVAPAPDVAVRTVVAEWSPGGHGGSRKSVERHSVVTAARCVTAERRSRLNVSKEATADYRTLCTGDKRRWHPSLSPHRRVAALHHER
ncbi:MAG: hypothetical protein JWL70_1526 [Acidimicrobiia bacterium]|nr:hypothetical protein [Acidimicrobiia bacterium]